MTRKQLHWLGIIAAAGVAIYFLRQAGKSSSSAAAVAGTVTSGNASITIDTNVLSPTFGQPITTS